MADDPIPTEDDPPTCDGIGHAWRVLPAEGNVQYAVARCCGVRAKSIFGVWKLVEDDGSPPAADAGSINQR